MEKEKLISTLKEKAGVDNLSDRTIDEVATMFLPQFADDEKITDESWQFPVQMVKTMSGQLRHDLSGGINAFKTQFETDTKAAQEKAIADAVSAAKAEWEKAHPIQEPPKQEPPKTEPDLDAKIADAVAKATTEQVKAFEKLSKQFSDYMAQVEEEKKAVAVNSVREQIKDYLIGRGVEEDDYALEICLEKLEIGDKPDVSALKTKAEKDYEAIYKRMHKNDGAQPFNGGGGSGTDSNTEFQNFIKEREAQAAQEAKDAEELKKYMM